MNRAPSVFGYLRGRLLRNSLRRMRPRAGRAAGAALLLALLWAGIHSAFFAGFDAFHRQYSELFIAGMHVLFALFFLIMFGLLAFSNSLVSYASLFRSWDAAFFRASPVSAARVFWNKVADSAAYSMWGLALLGLPIVLAFGRAVEADTWYYVFALCGIVLFTLLTVPLGAAAALLFVRFVLPSRRRALAGGMAVALVFVLLSAGEVARARGEADTSSPTLTPWLEGPMARITMARNPLLPSAWLADCVVGAATGDRAEAAYALALLGAGVVFLVSAAWALADVFYGTAFHAAHAGCRSSRRKGRLFYRAVERLLPTRSEFKRALVVKDLKVFLRTPAQWGQALLLCGVLLLYFTHFNMRQLGVRGAVVVSRDMSAFVNFIATALIVCTMTVRFAYPMVSLEGAAFWMLGTLPVERRDIVEAKFFSVALASLLCGGALIVASAVSLGVAGSVLALHLVGATVLALGLSALSIGLGAAYPSFGEASAAKIASGFGGTVNLVASAGFCAFILVFLVMPFHLRGGPDLAPPFRQMSEFRDWLGIGALAATLALLVGMSRVATRALETLEA